MALKPFAKIRVQTRFEVLWDTRGEPGLFNQCGVVADREAIIEAEAKFVGVQIFHEAGGGGIETFPIGHNFFADENLPEVWLPIRFVPTVSGVDDLCCPIRSTLGGDFDRL